jgi:GNAT superfamily N-acetyltransferase
MTATTKPAIRSAARTDLDTITRVLTAAFMHGDLAPWLIPARAHRERIYPRYFAMFAEHALDYGHVDITTDGLGVAIWYAHNDVHIAPIADYASRLKTITQPYTGRFVILDRAMARLHPTGKPHDYLAYLAVHPDRWANGYGTALLCHHHQTLDRQGRAAYLEATGLRNRRLYQRHGYTPQPAYPLGRNGPTLHPMWRRPHRPASIM